MNQGYATVFASCVNCRAPVCPHPRHAPSIRVYPEGGAPEGVREPICRACFDKWNQIHRTSQGLDPVALHPNAYGPFPAEEL